MKFLDASVDDLNAFNQFMKNNALWFALGLLAIIIIVVLIIVLTSIKRNKQKQMDQHVEDVLLTALGGKENVASIEQKGTRVAVKLKDFEKLDESMLNDLNVSYIKMSDKITIVSKKDAKKLASLLQ